MLFEIPQSEFDERIGRIQEELARRELDALLTHANEAEPQNVRYLADYWPAFESAGVLVPVEGDPILIIGPECYTYAKSRSKIAKIRRVLCYRESSEPEYPGVELATLEDLLDEVSGGRGVKRLGIVGYSIMTVPIHEAIKEAMVGGEVVRADDIVIEMRKIKSENELKLLREAYRLSQIGLDTIVNSIKPDMTELQVKAIALEAMMRGGAEAEGFPFWILFGSHTSQAISRPTNRKLKQGELVQINVGARFGGYSSSIGRGLVIGQASDDVKRLVNAAAEIERAVIDAMAAGVVAKDVDAVLTQTAANLGYREWLLYGPCHGTGLMECEHPWIESISNWRLQENMVFSVDVFLGSAFMGIRIEDGVRVIHGGVEQLSVCERGLIEI